MSKETVKKIDNAKVRRYLQESFVEVEEIIDLFNQGQITADEAVKIAQENGWEDQLLADPLFYGGPTEDVSDDWINETDFMNEADMIANDFNGETISPATKEMWAGKNLPEEGEVAEAKKVATNKKPNNFKTPTTPSGAATNKKPSRTGVNPQEPKQTSNVKKAGNTEECAKPKGLPNKSVAGVKTAGEFEESKKPKGIGNPPKGLPNKAVSGVKAASNVEESKKAAVAKQSKVAAKDKTDTKAKSSKEDFKKNAKGKTSVNKKKLVDDVNINPKLKALNESIEKLQAKKSLMEELELAKKQLSQLKQKQIKK